MNDMSFMEYDPLKEEKRSAAKSWVVLGGSIIYLLGLAFTLAHSYNLLIAPVADEAKWIAMLGVIALELNAIALPLAIHFWTHGSAHRGAAILFYALDIVMLYLNSNIDVHILRGAQMSSFMMWYRDAFAQVSPIYTVVVWAVLYSLDPAERAREKMKELIVHAQTSALRATTEWLKSPKFQETIERRGGEIGNHVLSQAFGNTVKEKSPEADTKEHETSLVASSNGRSGRISKSQKNFS